MILRATIINATQNDMIFDAKLSEKDSDEQETPAHD